MRKRANIELLQTRRTAASLKFVKKCVSNSWCADWFEERNLSVYSKRRGTHYPRFRERTTTVETPQKITWYDSWTIISASLKGRCRLWSLLLFYIVPIFMLDRLAILLCVFSIPDLPNTLLSFPFFSPLCVFFVQIWGDGFFIVKTYQCYVTYLPQCFINVVMNLYLPTCLLLAFLNSFFNPFFGRNLESLLVNWEDLRTSRLRGDGDSLTLCMPPH